MTLEAGKGTKDGNCNKLYRTVINPVEELDNGNVTLRLVN